MSEKQIFRSLNDVLNETHNRAVAIGNFDGVHLGHQAVLNASIDISRQQSLIPTALTFEPHPKHFFAKSDTIMRLTTSDEKCHALHNHGIQDVIVLPFDDDFSQVSAQEFVTDILFAKLKAKQISVGADFKFGHKRIGDVDLLKLLCDEQSVALDVLEKIHDFSNQVISSSAIRQFLADGEIEKATAMLGRPWRFSAKVQHGDKRGRELGYPTANLALRDGIQLKFGIYTVKLSLNGTLYGGVASYGRRPVFDNGKPLFEIYIFDFNQDIYNQEIRVDLIEWQRPELNFNSIDELINQMNKDSERARQTLSLL